MIAYSERKHKGEIERVTALEKVFFDYGMQIASLDRGAFASTGPIVSLLWINSAAC